jgi:hypothetical protein
MAGIRNLVTYGLDSELDNIATILKDEGYVTLGACPRIAKAIFYNNL